jgi:hypothetical protein
VPENAIALFAPKKPKTKKNKKTGGRRFQCYPVYSALLFPRRFRFTTASTEDDVQVSADKAEEKRYHKRR